MKMMRSVGISLVMILLSAPLVRGKDLSKYRGFSLGMSLPELSNQVDLRPLQTKLIQKRPSVNSRVDVVAARVFWLSAPVGCSFNRNRTMIPRELLVDERKFPVAGVDACDERVVRHRLFSSQSVKDSCWNAKKQQMWQQWVVTVSGFLG